MYVPYLCFVSCGVDSSRDLTTKQQLQHAAVRALVCPGDRTLTQLDQVDRAGLRVHSPNKAAAAAATANSGSGE